MLCVHEVFQWPEVILQGYYVYPKSNRRKKTCLLIIYKVKYVLKTETNEWMNECMDEYKDGETIRRMNGLISGWPNSQIDNFCIPFLCSH